MSGDPVRRVLLVRLSAMGDVVHCLGPVAALAAVRPDLEIGLVTQWEHAPLLQGLPCLTQVIGHDRRGGWRGFRDTARRGRTFRADVVLDLQGNWKSALMARLCRSRGAKALGGAVRREPGSRWLLQRPLLGDPGGRDHPAVVAADILRVLAPDVQPVPASLPRPADGEIAAEAAAVRTAGIEPARPFRVLVWIDGADNRAWPMAAMDDVTAVGDLPCLWLAGPAESHLQPPAGVHLLRHGPGDVRRLLALGHIVRDAGGEVLGPDTGATHVLAACGAMVHALFGPQDPAHTAPLAATVHQHPAPPACMPCRSRTCHHEDGPICMRFVPTVGEQGERPLDPAVPEPESP